MKYYSWVSALACPGVQELLNIETLIARRELRGELRCIASVKEVLNMPLQKLDIPPFLLRHRGYEIIQCHYTLEGLASLHWVPMPALDEPVVHTPSMRYVLSYPFTCKRYYSSRAANGKYFTKKELIDGLRRDFRHLFRNSASPTQTGVMGSKRYYIPVHSVCVYRCLFDPQKKLLVVEVDGTPVYYDPSLPF